MLAEIRLPDPNVDVLTFYLFDTNAVLELFSENSKRAQKFASKYTPFRKRIAKGIRDGTLQNGCITTAVLNEIPALIKNYENIDRETFNGRIQKFIADPKAVLHKVITPDSEHIKLKEVYSYLCKNLPRGSKGELSVLMTSLVSGIPLIISDDNDLYKSTVRNYIRNRFRERFPRPYIKQFDIVTSRDFCGLMKI